MKSAILSHSMEVKILVFFAYSTLILAWISKRICLDSLNPNNEHKNSLFPLTKSNCFLNIWTIFQVFSIYKWLTYNDKNQRRYLRGGKNNGDYDVSPFVLILPLRWSYGLLFMLTAKNLDRPRKRRFIVKTRLFKYIENFTTKNWKFSDKNSDIFHISAQNIDCWYSLEAPHRGSKEYP